MTEPAWGDELPLSTVESFIAAMVEAGPEVAEHMVRAANELLLAAQALTAAAERRLAEQRRIRDEADAAAAAAAEGPSGAGPSGATDDADASEVASPTEPHLRPVDHEVA